MVEHADGTPTPIEHRTDVLYAAAIWPDCDPDDLAHPAPPCDLFVQPPHGAPVDLIASRADNRLSVWILSPRPGWGEPDKLQTRVPAALWGVGKTSLEVSDDDRALVTSFQFVADCLELAKLLERR